mmetsp:Transcript_12396/g.24796  ORF Transcript_12396/g.24796 Transcript_12396/m.24796 type:complete len:98 (-) Transcript_12396:85-378(-)
MNLRIGTEQLFLGGLQFLHGGELRAQFLRFIVQCLLFFVDGVGECGLNVGGVGEEACVVVVEGGEEGGAADGEGFGGGGSLLGFLGVEDGGHFGVEV